MGLSDALWDVLAKDLWLAVYAIYTREVEQAALDIIRRRNHFLTIINKNILKVWANFVAKKTLQTKQLNPERFLDRIRLYRRLIKKKNQKQEKNRHRHHHHHRS